MTSRNLYTEQHTAGKFLRGGFLRGLLLAGLLLFGVQAIAQPIFNNGGAQTYTLCANAGGTDITSLLTAHDNAGAATFTWTLSVPATHGTVSNLPYASGVVGASTNTTPVGVTYTPNPSFVGSETIQVTVTDGFGSTTTNITFTNLPYPLPITIPSTVCANGSTITVTDGSNPGTYSTSGALFTFTGGSSGITTVTGVAAGTQNITYSLNSNSCYVTAQVTVSSAPSSITGSSQVCTGASAPYPTGLAVSPAGGTWATSNSFVATVNGSGVVTGVSNGTVTISYTLATGCYSTWPMNVYTTPLSITSGTGFTVCTGNAIAVASGTSGGIFSSSDGTLASVTATGGPGSGTANINGVSAGNPTITYTVPTGCFVYQPVVVNTTPSAIAGASSVCVGFSTVLTDLTAGGLWSSSNTLLGSVVASGAGAGTVTGIASGAPNISYTAANGCYVVLPFTVNNNPAAIAGSPFTVCTGFTNTVTDATGTGTWSSSNPGLASVNGATGVVTGNSIGVPTISYTLGTGCYAIQSYTVNQTPVATTGSSSLCVGATTTLTNTTGGGTWSTSDATKATVVAGTGVVTGVAAGSVTISYILASGCYALFPMTINSNPNPIGGPTTVCVGSNITATETTGGGTWSSSNTSQASIVSGTGLITGLAAGTPTISYIVGATGCYATESINVNTTPGTISGTTGICVGNTSTLASSPAGGTWTSSATGVATVNAGSGLVTGVAAGTANITYTLGSGCYAATTVTINPLPSAISGTFSVCVGATTTLSDGGGGIWTSSNNALATVGAGTGVVTGVAPGNPTITYTLPSGCSTTQVVAVNANPLAISGTTNACVGLTSTLSDGTAGPATWSSAGPAIASVNSLTGVVTGVSAGTTNISYSITATGCYATTSFVVNPNPASIGGTLSVCTGSTTALTNATGSGTWSSSDVTKATVNAATGVVTGIAAGSVTISYTLATGCYATATVVVNQTPAAITGTQNVCVGLTTALADATTPAGTWSSSNTALATVNAGTGVVTGVAAGVPGITYTMATGCYTVAPVTVNPNPAVPGGTLNVCVGSTTLLTDATSGGTWSSSNPALATVGAGTGIVTGVLAGSPSIVYTLPTGCLNTATVVVNPLPAAIAGTFNVCTGSTTTLTDATPGPGTTWSSSNTAMATIAGGVVTGVAAGVPTITYSINATGCYVTQPVTVNQTPPAIIGTTNVCVGLTSTLSDATTGGIWTSSNTSFATVGAGTGTVTGVGAGSPTITYTVPTGCFVTTAFVVNPLPAAITGTTNVCIGLTTTLADATLPAGTWTTSNAAEATVGGGTGVVTGVSTGTPIITYTLATGCYATTPVTVNPNPTTITGAATVCTGYTTTFASTPGGGVWSSNNTASATVGAGTGIVTGVTPGSPTITYTLPTGCLATKGIVVNQTPAAIAGTTNVCIGLTTTLTDATTPAGTWTSSNSAEATVGAGTGIVTGIASGIPLITYTMGTGCYVTTPVTVNPNPASITGATTVCTGQTIGLSDVTAGGTWTSSDPTKATINAATGVVTGVAAGSVTMTYSLATGCLATYAIVVNTTPSAITGTTTVCTGATTTLADATPGGTWTSSNTAEATVGAVTGVVTGVASGTPTITYTMGSGCYVTASVVVNQTPPASTGTASVCVGLTTVLSNTLAGGTWSTSNPAQATVGAATGIVTGVAAGSPSIFYTMPTGCNTVTTVVVNPTPAAVTGPSVVCVGSNITMNDATAGGIWSSGNTSVATIGGGTGIVTGVAAGAVGITYTLGAGCTASTTITVNPVPNISNFTSTVATSECVGLGGTVTVSSTSLGSGTFTVTYNLSGANAVTGATATLTMGATNGTFTIPSASLSGTGFTTVTITGISNTLGCLSVPISNNTSTFSVYPLPTVYNVTGGGGYCVGGTGVHVYLSNSVGGINYQLWLGATPIGAPVAGTFSGLDFGLITTVGTYTVTATNATTGCSSNMFGSATVFTNALPTNTFTVTGGGSYCAGGTGVSVGLSSSQSGISYQLYVGGIATGSAIAGSGAALSFGLQTTAGVYTVIGTNTTTLCTSTMTGSQTVVINPLPAAVTGTMFLCPGTTTTLADATSGGTWSSLTPGVATVGASTGVVTGVAAGTATIVYTLPTGCTNSAVVTVNPLPAAISGLNTVCAGSAITLTDATGTGNWTSSNTLLATVGITSGIVTGVAAGTPTITYTLSTGCYVTFNITVNPTPVAVTGPNSVCAGQSTTVIDLTSGGTWTSSAPATGSVVGATGVVTGVSVGTLTLTYTLPAGCFVTYPFTVNPIPAAITGTATVCVGATTILADATSGGAWSSSNTAIATAGVGSGVISGISAGIATITYTLPAGCTSVTNVTVNPIPASITGTNNVCVGLTTTLSNTVAGGTWSSSNTAIATASGTGVITGVAAGSVNITYTLPAGCFVVFPFTVNPLPASITGVASVCVGSTTALTDASTGGTWTSSNPALGSISAGGVVTGIAAGTPTITYTLPTGCLITTSVTVNPLPLAITGIFTVCAGANTNLSDASASGTWTSNNIAIATIGSSTGTVTGVTAGSTTITYTLPTGCIATQGVTVYPAPAAISGSGTVCVGLTTTLSDAISGGTWSSSNPSLGSISALGVVTGIATGNPTITYTLPAPGSCFTTMIETVNPQPVAITGVFTVCSGLNTTLTDATTGGTWSSSNLSVGTVNAATGVVTGIAAGTVTMTYTLPAGCFVTQNVTVYPTPVTVTGTPTVCVGLTTALADLSAGGSWSSSNSAVGSISGTGVVTGVSAGTTVITYTLPPGGCIAVYNVTVNALPAAITGTTNVCVGSTTTLSDVTPGGSWSSSNTATATIGGFSGIVTGVSPGAVTYTYTLPTSCIATVTGAVNALPNIYSVTGGGTYCAGGSGSTVGLSNSDIGVNYQLMNGLVPVGSPVAGTGSPISFGTLFTGTTYTVVATNTTTGCTNVMSGSATITVTVLPTVYSVTGGGAYCAGSAGLSVGLGASNPGINYQLYLNGSAFGSPVPGSLTGGAITFGVMTGAGTYTVIATNTTTTCTNNMAGAAVIVVNPLPTAFTVTGGGINCAGSPGVHIGLSNSTTGVNYTLSPAAISLPGTTGAAIDFGLISTAGTYTITALNSSTLCSNTMLGTAIVTTGALPVTTYNITPSVLSSYCAGGTGIVVGMGAGSQTGVSYQLYNGTSAVGAPVNGTGANITFGSQLAPGAYTIKGTVISTGCIATMGGTATVSVNPAPVNTYTVGGGGTYCSGGGGLPITINPTDVGVSYEVLNSLGSAVTGFIAGTGTLVSLGSQTAAGTYTVLARNNTTLCTSTETGSATIGIAPLPNQYAVTVSGGVPSYCPGGSGLNILLSSSDLGINYQLYNSGVALGAPVPGTGAGLTFGPLTAGTYTISGINPLTLCSNGMNGTIIISTYAIPTAFNISTGGSYCAGGAGIDITLSGSQSGVRYQLYNTGGPVGIPVLGTGSLLDFGFQTATGVYTIVATNLATNCTNNMNGSATITINAAPTANLVSGGGSYCAGGTGVNVSLNGSIIGYNYQLFKGTSIIGSPVAGTSAPINFGNQTLPGIYTVVATNTATGCSGPMTGSATVVVNPAPVSTYSVTGGGSYCTGGSGLLVGLSGSDTGVSYQLYNGGAIAGSAVAGTGSAISFGLHVSNGIRTVIGTQVSTGCTSTMTGSVSITINPLPNLHVVTGGGAYCPGGPGRTIGLDSSNIGVNYQLYLGTSPVGASVAGTNGAISFGLQTGVGTYSVRAINAATGCSIVMTGSAVISLNALPAAFTVTGGGGYCVGGTGADVMLSGSVSGVNYQLYNGTSTVGIAVAGGGSTIDFGPQTGLGVYTVVGTSTSTSCSNNMTGSVTVSLNPLPVPYSVTGGGSYCAGGAGLSIGLSGSDATISYQLYNGTTMVGPALAGGGALNFGLQTTPGTYTVKATNSVTSCMNNMLGSETISINPLPNVYTVGGGGAYCAGGIGDSVTLSSSDAGINYQLKNGGINVGGPVAGLGGVLNFGPQTAAGSYTVVATNAITSCTSNMSGSTTVSVNPLPSALFVVTGTGNYCAGGSGLAVGLSGSNTGINYQLYRGTTSVGLMHAGTGSSINFGLQTVAGSYTVMGTNPATGCAANMTGNAMIGVNPLPIVDTVTGGGNYCPGGAGNHIGLSSSSLGVNYQLYRGILPLGSPVAGTGSGLDFGLQSITGTYFATATDTATGCSINMVGSPTIGISALPAAYNVLASSTGYCVGGPGVDITLSGSDAGTSYQLYLGGVPAGSALSGTGFTLNFGAQTSAGTYSVVATNLTTGCTNNMTGTPSIVINPLPNLYNVTGGGAFCAGGAGVGIMLVGSDGGVNYQLYNGTATVGSAMSGTGYSLNYGLQTAPGTYTVVATNATTGCTSAMLSTASVILNPLPTAYFVVGGGSYCAGSAGVDLGISGSDSGTNYQLFNGTTALSVLPGNGSALNFGPQTGAGSYTVIATNAVTSCSVAMTGTQSVTVNALPASFTVTGGGNYCTGGSGVHVGLSGSVSGVNYQLKLGSSPVGTPLAGTGAALDFGLQSATGTYTVEASSVATGCVVTMTGSVIVSVSSLPAVYNVTGGGAYCASLPGVSVGLFSSQIGVNYQLYSGGSTVGGVVAGTNSAINFGLHPAGTYTVVAINASTGCTSNMTGSAVVSVMPSVVPAVSITTGVGDTVCTGTTVTFAAHSVNGGTLPSFLWSVNGVSTGATDSTYTFVPSNGNVVSVMMTSNEACPLPATASTSLTMTVRPDITPSVTIAVTPGSRVCHGTTVDLVATPVNGGATPSYSWHIGGAPVGSGNTYTYIPSDSDVVFCTMTSSYACVTTGTVLSNNIQFTVENSLPPTVTVQLNSGVNSGTVLYNDTLTAVVDHAGTNTVYQWSVNGVVTGGNTAVLLRSSLNDLDQVTCTVSDSNSCGYLVGENTITVHSSNVGVHTVPSISGEIRLVPNPNKGTFTVKGSLTSTDEQQVTIEVTDVLGQSIYTGKVIAHNGVLDEKVQINSAVPNGMYMVSVRTGNDTRVFHMVIEQ